jgi:hypothetical protein
MNPEQMPQEVPSAMPQVPQGMPEMPEGIPSEQPTGEPITGEQRMEIEDLLAKLQEAKDRLDALQLDADNKAEMMRTKMLRKVFGDLQSVGVNLEDQQSVGAFIQELRAMSPELAEQFENSMNVLLGNDVPQEPASMDEPVDVNAPIQENNEMENEILPQGIRGQV